MKTGDTLQRTRLLNVLIVLAASCLPAPYCFAQVNNWTNPASGHWEDAAWSLGVLPSTNQSVYITNAGYKAVGIFPSTTAGYPQSMVIKDLTLSAPTNALSVLLLNYAGTAVPLRILNNCSVLSNATLLNLYSSVAMGSNGVMQLNGGTYAQEGGTLLGSNSTAIITAGAMRFTNSTVTLNTLRADYNSLGSTANVTEAGGTVTANITLSGGSGFELLDGMLYGSMGIGAGGSGNVTQSGGTNRATLTLGTGNYYIPDGSGSYTMYGGRLDNDSIALATSYAAYPFATFTQAGGSVKTTSLWVGASGLSSATYSLQSGDLNSSLFIGNGSFSQSGGQHVTGPINLSGSFDDYNPIFRTHAFYSLSGGLLRTPSVFIYRFGSFTQSGGTNLCASVTADSSDYSLSGGELRTTSTTVNFGSYLVLGDGSYLFQGRFDQAGGLHFVTNTLSIGGVYSMGGGSLIVSNIVVSGQFQIVTNTVQIQNSGSITLTNGTIFLDNTSCHLGMLGLYAKSSITFGSNAVTVSFDSSATAQWNPTALLVISNWHGNLSGGGLSQFRVGSNAAGLNNPQLAHVEFVDPASFPPGRYGARILATGEIVPSQNAFLSLVRAGSNSLITWPGNYTLQSATNVAGPYADVASATSPFTNPAPTLPRQFFRLRN